MYENPTTEVTILYQDRRSETLFYHSKAKESPTDYGGGVGGVERLGTKNGEVLRNQELVKIPLRELNRCWPIQVGIISERDFIVGIVKRTRSQRADLVV